jgi:signal transduction histidine kinase
MAIALKGTGNLKESIHYFELYTDQSDSLTKEKISQNLADQEIRYETAKKEQHIVSLSKENKLSSLELQAASRTKLFLVLALVALGIIALLLYFIYRNKERANQILNQQNSQLDLLNQKLEVANTTKAKLFGIIGHDLRSPISQVVQLLQIRKEESSRMSEKARLDHENKIQEASESVLDTMEDLLLWSKSQMQQFTPQLENVNITEILEKELLLLTQLIKEKSVRINMGVQSRFFQKTDGNIASVVIRNLLQNAIKYCDKDSTVEISNDSEKLIISNQRSDMHADRLNELLNNKEVNSKNSGLGLQIVKDLADIIHIQIKFLQEEKNRILSVINWTI